MSLTYLKVTLNTNILELLDYYIYSGILSINSFTNIFKYLIIVVVSNKLLKGHQFTAFSVKVRSSRIMKQRMRVQLLKESSFYLKICNMSASTLKKKMIFLKHIVYGIVETISPFTLQMQLSLDLNIFSDSIVIAYYPQTILPYLCS